MLDAGSNLGLFPVGSCDGLRHRLALRLLAMDLAAQAVPGQMLFVLCRAVGRVRPYDAGGVLLVDQALQIPPLLAGGVSFPPRARSSLGAGPRLVFSPNTRVAG